MKKVLRSLATLLGLIAMSPPASASETPEMIWLTGTVDQASLVMLFDGPESWAPTPQQKQMHEMYGVESLLPTIPCSSSADGKKKPYLMLLPPDNGFAPEAPYPKALLQFPTKWLPGDGEAWSGACFAQSSDGTDYVIVFEVQPS